MRGGSGKVVALAGRKAAWGTAHSGGGGAEAAAGQACYGADRIMTTLATAVITVPTPCWKMAYGLIRLRSFLSQEPPRHQRSAGQRGPHLAGGLSDAASNTCVLQVLHKLGRLNNQH